MDAEPVSTNRGRQGERLEMPDAEVIFYRGLFPEAQSDELYQALLSGTDWKQRSIKLYGKEVPLPRLTAWHGEPGKAYRYSGIKEEPAPWTPALLAVKREIEAVSGASFNSALLNLYRDGRDSVSWHSDDEPELGEAPVIGSVSFGAPSSRNFLSPAPYFATVSGDSFEISSASASADDVRMPTACEVNVSRPFILPLVSMSRRK